MRSQRRQTRADVVALPAIDSTLLNQRFASAQASEEDIARRAYELYCARGGQHGYDLADWLQAEQELRSGSRTTAA